MKYLLLILLSMNYCIMLNLIASYREHSNRLPGGNYVKEIPPYNTNSSSNLKKSSLPSELINQINKNNPQKPVISPAQIDQMVKKALNESDVTQTQSNNNLVFNPINAIQRANLIQEKKLRPQKKQPNVIASNYDVPLNSGSLSFLFEKNTNNSGVQEALSQKTQKPQQTELPNLVPGVEGFRLPSNAEAKVETSTTQLVASQEPNQKKLVAASEEFSFPKKITNSVENFKVEDALTKPQKNQQKELSPDTFAKINVAQKKGDYNNFLKVIGISEENLKTPGGIKYYFSNPTKLENDQYVQKIKTFYENINNDVNDGYVLISKDIAALDTKRKNENDPNLKKSLENLLADAQAARDQLKDDIIEQFKNKYMPEQNVNNIGQAKYSLSQVNQQSNDLVNNLTTGLNITIDKNYKNSPNEKEFQTNVVEIATELETSLRNIYNFVNNLKSTNKNLEDAIDSAEKTLTEINNGFYISNNNYNKNDIIKYYPQAIAQLKLELAIEKKVNLKIKDPVLKKVNEAWRDIQSQKLNIPLILKNDKNNYDNQLIFNEIQKIIEKDTDPNAQEVKNLVVNKKKSKDLTLMKSDLNNKKKSVELGSPQAIVIDNYLAVIDGLENKIAVEKNINIGLEKVLDNYYNNDFLKNNQLKDGLKQLLENKDNTVEEWNDFFTSNGIRDDINVLYKNEKNSGEGIFKLPKDLSKDDLESFIVRLKDQKQAIDGNVETLPKNNVELIKGISIFDAKKLDTLNPKADVVHPLYTQVAIELTALKDAVALDSNINVADKGYISKKLDQLVKDYNPAQTDTVKINQINTIINTIKDLYIQYPRDKFNVALQVMLQIELKIEQLQKYTQVINNFIDNLTANELKDLPDNIKKAQALSADNKKDLADLLNFIDKSQNRKLTQAEISPEEIKALYEKIDTELKVKKTIEFQDTQVGKLSDVLFNRIPKAVENKSVYGVVVGAVQGVGHGVATVGDAGASFTNCVGEIFAAIGLRKENFSIATLNAIAGVGITLATVLKLIQSNNNLTDDQKKKLMQDASLSAVTDTVVLGVADQTGADLNTVKVLVDNLLTGTASTDDVQNIAINAGFNKAIQSLAPDAKNMQMQMNLKNYDSNFTKFQNEYDIWSKKQEAGVDAGPLPSFKFGNGMSSEEFLNRSSSISAPAPSTGQFIQNQSATVAPRRPQILGGIGAITQQTGLSSQSYQNVSLPFSLAGYP